MTVNPIGTKSFAFFVASSSYVFHFKNKITIEWQLKQYL